MNVVMPQLGETVTEGTLIAWHKKVGDRVEANELLFEVGTDKVDTEVPAPASGVLSEILIGEGETVSVGVKLAEIADGAAAQDKPMETAGATASPLTVGGSSPSPTSNTGERLSPVVRKLIAEHRLDPTDIGGTGRDGRITRKDVLAHIEKCGGPRDAAKKDGGATESLVVPFDKLRRLTAEHMVRSKAVSAHVLQAVEVDFQIVDAARRSAQAAWKAKEGFALSYLPFIALAVCEAIADYPHVNACVDGDNLIVHRRVNLAIAVDLDHAGLVAPVVKDTQRMSLRQLAVAIHDIAQRSKQRNLRPDDTTEGTYTISNAGTFGTLITAPIINQPQVAILSTDAVAKRPVVVEGPHGDAIAIHPIGILAQSFDHRAFDGAYSAAFLRRIKEIIEERDWRAALGG